jgi:hypothetical protein
VRSVYPILPILALFTGCGVWRVAVLLSARRRARASAMAAVILFALATASGAEAISQQRRLLARSDTRIKVAAWLVDHVPRGERVAVLDLVALHPSVIRTLPGSVEVVTLADQARLLEADWVVLPALSPESEQDDRDRLDQLRARLAAQRRPLAYQTGRAAAAGQKSAFRPTGTKLSVFGPPPTRPTQPSPRTDAGK